MALAQKAAFTQSFVTALGVKAHDALDLEEDKNTCLHPFFDCAAADSITLGENFLGHKWTLDLTSVPGWEIHQLFGFAVTLRQMDFSKWDFDFGSPGVGGHSQPHRKRPVLVQSEHG